MDSQVVVPLTCRGRQLISASVALEQTAWHATSSTNDKFRADVGWRHPKDLHVSARLSSSPDSPRNEVIWVKMSLPTRDRSTVAAAATGRSSIGGAPWSRLPLVAGRPLGICAVPPRGGSAAVVTPTPSSDVLGRFALPSPAILAEANCFKTGLRNGQYLLRKSFRLAFGRLQSHESSKEKSTHLQSPSESES
ncbi:hypothetical protein THAOC_33398 [Thalassiosira oceanica]|uniref:Uncharacterized protein n=1 Tax=Thalassiosira oceanica TaxID=159749 RepID=K0RFW6_THAOC|nr:hypothetical protein THAOC_33398 [Thalassiosira oceanica]|eukprot:EJK47856.1 hypothetical protein THAOC_33398 [Thalassiosira oceanica]